MNVGFLIIVAVPLGVYLLILLFSMRGIGTGESDAEHAHADVNLADAEAENALSAHAGQDAAEDVVPDVDAAVVMEPSAPALKADVVTVSGSPASVTSEQDHEREFSTPPAAAAQMETDAGDGSGTPAVESTFAPIESAGVAGQTTASDESPMVAEHTTAAEALATPESATAVESATDQPDAIATPETSEVVAATETVSPAAEAIATTAPAATPPVVAEPPEPEEAEPILPEGPIQLPDKGSPKYAFDYRGRLWVEKKRKGFFRQLRRPQIPPEDPSSNSQR